MIDVYEFTQHPELANNMIEDDTQETDIFYYQQFIRDMDTEDAIWPFGYEAA